jgi:hypothetical protein
MTATIEAPPAIRQFLTERTDAVKNKLVLFKCESWKVDDYRTQLSEKLQADFGQGEQQAKEIATTYMREIVKVVLEEMRGKPTPTNVTINFTNCFNVVTDPAKPKPRSLSFQRIDDDSLDLTDRIILSLCHQFAYSNQLRPPKPVTLRRLRKVTSCRHATVTRSISKLRERGYLDGFSPLAKDQRYRGFAKLRWTPTGRGIDRDVFDAYCDAIGKKHNASYATRYTGVSRRTYFYRLNSKK